MSNPPPLVRVSGHPIRRRDGGLRGSAETERHRCWAGQGGTPRRGTSSRKKKKPRVSYGGLCCVRRRSLVAEGGGGGVPRFLPSVRTLSSVCVKTTMKFCSSSMVQPSLVLSHSSVSFARAKCFLIWFQCGRTELNCDTPAGDERIISNWGCLRA